MPDKKKKENVIALVLIAVGIFLFISMMTDATGALGAAVSFFIKGCFGLCGYVLPFYLVAYGILLLVYSMARLNIRTIIWNIVLFCDITVVNSLRYDDINNSSFGFSFIGEMFQRGTELESGGAVGMTAGWLLVRLVGTTGVFILGVLLFLISLMFLIDTPVTEFFDGLKLKKKRDREERKNYDGASEKKGTPLISRITGIEFTGRRQKDKQDKNGESSGNDDTKDVEGEDKENREDKEDNENKGDNGDYGDNKMKPYDDKLLSSDEKQILAYLNDDDLFGEADEKTINSSDLNFNYSADSSDAEEYEDVQPAKPTLMEILTSKINAKKALKTIERDSRKNALEISAMPDIKREKEENTGNEDEAVTFEDIFGEQLPSETGSEENSGENFLRVKKIKMPDFISDPDVIEKEEPQLAVWSEEEDASETESAAEEAAESYDKADDESEIEDNISEIWASAEEDTKSYDETETGQDIFEAEAGAEYSEDDEVIAEEDTVLEASEEEYADTEESMQQEDASEVSFNGRNLKYTLPPVDLLREIERNHRTEADELLKGAEHLEKVLSDFGVNAKVVDVNRGPTVTRYEVQPATGVKVSKIVNLSDDIALNMRARSLRIEAPIPGKAAVGIEIENEHPETVSLREIIDSAEFRESKSKLSFAVGEDITGDPVIADLQGMPHMLIAGSTGSGKSVCINSIIMSLLYRATPDEVRLILIDPKVVELESYNGIPHMLIPVVTDPNKAAAALGWAVQEMNRRYKELAAESVKNLKSYNEKMLKEGRTGDVMPQIVIIIDELADLMIAAAKQVEQHIQRLTQLARAAGMHLIVATQRPSVDVVTGVIKSNIPSRIAFAVSSQVDSRTILDRSGAEKLLGKGDMLFSPIGKSRPERLQGPFVTDEEVEAVIDFWKHQVITDEEAKEQERAILNEIDSAVSNSDEQDSESILSDEDDLYEDAVDLVLSAEQASASMLQRRFRIGYNRAGRLIDMMEARNIIGPSEGSKPRKVLISRDEYYGTEE